MHLQQRQGQIDSICCFSFMPPWIAWEMQPMEDPANELPGGRNCIQAKKEEIAFSKF